MLPALVPTQVHCPSLLLHLRQTLCGPLNAADAACTATGAFSAPLVLEAVPHPHHFPASLLHLLLQPLGLAAHVPLLHLPDPVHPAPAQPPPVAASVGSPCHPLLSTPPLQVGTVPPACRCWQCCCWWACPCWGCCPSSWLQGGSCAGGCSPGAARAQAAVKGPRLPEQRQLLARALGQHHYSHQRVLVPAAAAAVPGTLMAPEPLFLAPAGCCCCCLLGVVLEVAG
mmetsp:Transcript_19262/g.49035  ORF Transcript_19262/g.49035 Transcript_19262/m.49035 type:complete len:227 (-) Transcript_19262:258-938(-)